MKIFALISSIVVASSVLSQAGPAEEKAFTDKYKQAFEAKDTTTLNSFLYTTGADPNIVSFFQMMMAAEAGKKIAKIELAALSPEEEKKVSEAVDSPDGKKVCMPIKPTKKLIVEIADDGGKSTTTSMVAEKDGKLVMPVPGPCK